MVLPIEFDTTRTREQHIADHRALHRRNNSVVSVEDYGGIQAAIDAAQSTGTGIVRLGSGAWDYDSTPLITRPANLLIQGNGPSRTILRPAAGVDGLTVAGATYGAHFKVSDLTIQGGAVGLHIAQGAELDLALERVEFAGQSVANVWTEVGTYNAHIIDCGFRSAPIGIKVSEFAHLWHLDTCRFRVLSDAALELFQARAWQIDNCLFEANTGNVARLHRCHTIHLDGGWLENNGVGTDATLFVITGELLEDESVRRSWDICIEAMYLNNAPTVFLDASNEYVERVSLVRQATNSSALFLPGGRVIPYLEGAGRVLTIDASTIYQYGADGTLWRVNVDANGVESRVQVGA